MGFFSNDYPDRMPFLERMGKELRFRKAVAVAQATRPTAVRPGPPRLAEQARQHHGLRRRPRLGGDQPQDTARPIQGPVRIQLAFDDRTEKRQAQPGFWNGHCLDISKSTLDRHHQRGLRLRRQRGSTDPQRPDARKIRGQRRPRWPGDLKGPSRS